MRSRLATSSRALCGPAPPPDRPALPAQEPTRPALDAAALTFGLQFYCLAVNFRMALTRFCLGRPFRGPDPSAHFLLPRLGSAWQLAARLAGERGRRLSRRAALA